jgi:tetratricopeptide (TPR) repeat protein
VRATGIAVRDTDWWVVNISLRMNIIFARTLAGFGGLVLLSVGSSCALRHDPLERGQRLFEKGDYQKAVLEYRTALQRQPNSAEALYRLGVVLNRLDQPREAYDTLTKAAARLGRDHDVHLELAKLCVSMYMVNPRRPAVWSGQALEVANRLLDRNPQSFDGLRLKGLLAVADGRTEAAIEYLESANRERPEAADVATLLVQNLLLVRRYADAERLAADVIRRHPQYAPIYDTMYAYHVSAQRPQRAEEQLLAKVRKNPANHLFTIQLCRHYRRTGQIERMTAALEQLRQAHHDGWLLAGDFLAETGRIEEALRSYKEGAAAKSDRRAVYEKRQVKLYLAVGEPDKALAILANILTRDSKDHEARAYRAHIWMQSGVKQQEERATSEFEELIRLHPDSTDYAFGLSEAYRRRGLDEEAEQRLLQIVGRKSDHQLALQSLAELSIKKRSFIKALNYAEELLRLSPRNASGRLVQAACLAAFGQYAQARERLNDLVQEQPGLVEARLQLALLNVIEKRYAEAERILRQVQGSSRGDVRLLRHWVELYGAQDRSPQALQLVQHEMKTSAAPVPLRSLLALTAARSGNYGLAIETYRKLAIDEPRSPEFQERLGALYIDAGEWGHAIEALEKARDLRPSDPQILARLGSAMQLAGRAEDAEKQLRRSLDLASDPVVMNNLAQSLAQHGQNLDEALSLAQKAVERLPGNLMVEDTLGFIYLRKGMVTNARAIFERLVRQQGGNPTFRHHLGLTLLRLGDQRGNLELYAALRLNPGPAERRSIESTLTKIAATAATGMSTQVAR